MCTHAILYKLFTISKIPQFPLEQLYNSINLLTGTMNPKTYLHKENKKFLFLNILSSCIIRSLIKPVCSSKCLLIGLKHCQCEKTTANCHVHYWWNPLFPNDCNEFCCLSLMVVVISKEGFISHDSKTKHRINQFNGKQDVWWVSSSAEENKI